MVKRRYRLVIEDILDIERARARFEIKSPIVKPNSYPIGQGSRGDVYEAYMDNCRVAVKVMRGTPEEVWKTKKHIVREIVVWARLKHPNVAPFYGLMYDRAFGSLPGMVSLFIEYDLMTYTCNTQNPQSRSKQIHEIAQGIHYLHSQLVIHGDIKAGNVRVSADGHPKLIDFGMSKLENVRGFTSMWNPNPRYFAPELLDGEDGVRPTFKSDVYSFGMLMLRVRHGRDRDPVTNRDRSLPYNEFPDNRVTTNLYLAVIGGRRPSQARYKNITQSQWELLELCWNKDPARRPSMTEILRYLPPS